MERGRIRENPFMRLWTDLMQTHATFDVVNLPPTGPEPTAAFDLAIEGFTVHLDNQSSGASLYYWMLGDGAASNENRTTERA